MTAPRRIDEPQEGCWLIRLHKQGPLTAARIWFERLPEHAALPIDPWPNSETRIVGVFAEIAGKLCSVEEIWHRRGTPITHAEYQYQASVAGWARQYQPAAPEAKPTEPVRLRELDMPF